MVQTVGSKLGNLAENQGCELMAPSQDWVKKAQKLPLGNNVMTT